MHYFAPIKNYFAVMKQFIVAYNSYCYLDIALVTVMFMLSFRFSFTSFIYDFNYYYQVFC